MIANPKSLLSLLLVHKFEIPLYQRHYEWTEVHCVALWEDFTRMIENPSHCHYLGTMIVEQHRTSLHIVDGQQRITTVMLLLKALEGHLNVDGPGSLASLAFMPDSDGTQALRLIPQGKSREGSDYMKFLAVMDPQNTQSNLDAGGFSTNLECFRGKVEKYEEKGRLTVECVLSALERMHLAIVELDQHGQDSDDPQTIFEKINSEGKNLEVHDLIRNFVFMLAAESDSQLSNANTKQRSLHMNGWRHLESEFPDRAFHQMKHFFRDYLIIKTGSTDITSGSDLYRKFMDFCLSVQKHQIGCGDAETCEENESIKSFAVVELLVNDLWKHADAWGKVVFANPIKTSSEKLVQQLLEFASIANAAYYPLATLLLIHGADNCGITNQKNLAAVFESLNKFITISGITGCHVNLNRDYSKQFMGPNADTAKLKSLIDNPRAFASELSNMWGNEFDYGEEIKRALLGCSSIPHDLQENDLQQEMASGDFEQTEDFNEPSSEKHSENSDSNLPDVYHEKSRVITHLLLKINEFMMTQSGDSMMRFADNRHSLEHIIPQTPDNGWENLDRETRLKYQHCLGNLTIIGAPYNSTIKNCSLVDKVAYYEMSNYLMTRELANDIKRSAATQDLNKIFCVIESRMKDLTEMAIKILYL